MFYSNYLYEYSGVFKKVLFPSIKGGSRAALSISI
jgi:hypothetical protein